jgi:hypothetical protein
MNAEKRAEGGRLPALRWGVWLSVLVYKIFDAVIALIFRLLQVLNDKINLIWREHDLVLGGALNFGLLRQPNGAAVIN